MQDNRFKRETFAESSNHSFNNTAWNIVLRRTKDWYPDHDYNKLLERSENRHQYEEGFIRGSIFAESLYKSVSENILNNPELGRLVILNGPPGTGKTHLIKNLTQDFAHKARVLFMSPDLVSQVGGPYFNKFLIEQSNHGLPIVIVVEDADFLISKRNKESVAALSALLNLGDGICGEAFDTRIICTSNEEEVHIDDAILRPGRLFCRIEVGNLEPEKANNLIKMELGDDSDVRYEESVSLGTVFTKINTIKRNKVLAEN